MSLNRTDLIKRYIKDGGDYYSDKVSQFPQTTSYKQMRKQANNATKFTCEQMRLCRDRVERYAANCEALEHGKEAEYTADDLYDVFQDISLQHQSKWRQLDENKWHLAGCWETLQNAPQRHARFMESIHKAAQEKYDKKPQFASDPEIFDARRVKSGSRIAQLDEFIELCNEKVAKACRETMPTEVISQQEQSGETPSTDLQSVKEFSELSRRVGKILEIS